MITFSNFNLIEDLEIHCLKPLQFKLKKSLLVKNKKEIYIPKGFITDGMSIPKWLQPVIGEPFEGNTLRAAIVHDYLCHLNGAKEALLKAIKDEDLGRFVQLLQVMTQSKCETQAFTHGIFREILKLDGVSAWRRNAAWLGVVAYNRLKNPKWK